MNTVKEYYNKSGGREYIHFCVSFQGKPDVYIVYDIANIVVEYYPEYQVIFAIHLNTSRVYAHMYAEVKVRISKTVSGALFGP